MRTLMKIYDLFSADDGHAVVAGADSKLDTLGKSEISQCFESSVSIRAPNSQDIETFALLGIEVSQSLVDKKNVFLKLNVQLEGARHLLGGEVLVS